MSLINTYRNIHWKQWLVLLAFWTFIATFISTQFYFNTIKNGGNPNWWIILRDQIPIWYLWAGITPLILYVVNKFPLSINSLWKPLLIYLLFGMALLLVMSNLTLIYMFLTHGYIDLGNTNFQEYSPYFYSRVANDGQIYIFTLAIIISVRSYGIRKNTELNVALMQLKNDQLQNQLTQAQLQALKLQLNPHFLFNTLHTISSLTLTGDNKASAKVTTRLGDFLRRTLEYEEHQLVSLTKELEFFDLYLEIESVRFTDRLNVEKEIEQSALAVRLPNLILQPLVENAVKHGVSRSKNARLIKLTIDKVDDRLLIQLYNDGPLLNSNPVNGIGVSNIQKRLEKLYQDNFKFVLENDESGNGVNSILEIPLEPKNTND